MAAESGMRVHNTLIQCAPDNTPTGPSVSRDGQITSSPVTCQSLSSPANTSVIMCVESLPL